MKRGRAIACVLLVVIAVLTLTGNKFCILIAALLIGLLIGVLLGVVAIYGSKENVIG